MLLSTCLNCMDKDTQGNCSSYLQVNQSHLSPHWLCKAKEVSQNIVSYFGEDGFRVKLNPLHYIVSVSHSHYYAFLCFRSDFETGRKAVSFDD